MKKQQNLIGKILILVGFIIGIILGMVYHQTLTGYAQKVLYLIKKPAYDKLYFCPSTSMILSQHKKQNAGTFKVGSLYWRLDYQGGNTPENIGFMQALFTEDHNVVCYYQWPNPATPQTFLWTTYRLSPPVHQRVKLYESYWVKYPKTALCTAGIHACGFILEND